MWFAPARGVSLSCLGGVDLSGKLCLSHARESGNMFQHYGFRMPLGLSALTSLRCFDAKIASTSTLTLNAFCELTSLQDLKIHVRGGSLFANTGMSQLSMLTSLSLLASAGRKDVGVQIFMEWLECRRYRC